MKQERKNQPGFADDTSKTMTDYLETLVKRRDKKEAVDLSDENATKAVDFDGFGTKHASLLLKQTK
jgi:hypothetical protein